VSNRNRLLTRLVGWTLAFLFFLGVYLFVVGLSHW
jgi:hypothetical protein